jgi:hypothetical protein
MLGPGEGDLLVLFLLYLLRHKIGWIRKPK